jgi:hexosaminidase
MLGAVLALVALHVLPRPQHIEPLSCAASGAPFPRSVPSRFDDGAFEELNARWRALGIGVLHRDANDTGIRVQRVADLGAQAYRLTVDRSGVRIQSSSDTGTFYASMTLAQLPVRNDNRWMLPCVSISDEPALQWRILSDDVSRGPLPTMPYFKERIRTIAAFKMNGYSPYMEHVFVAPSDPLPAPLDGITPQQLHELDVYSRRFHVALIPEQQTFAHMHNTLRLEQYASAAELPHGFLISPNVALGTQYLARLIAAELAVVPHPPFFHIGSDETSTLGAGQTQQYVAERGRSQAYADHINAMARLIAPSGARVMLWDDGIEADPHILQLIPKNAVIVNWHYGSEKTYEPYIRMIAGGGFQQMVAPGANNWNQLFPDIAVAIPNERRFITEGKAAHVLGLFQTVWNDDGETLFEMTWYPVLYAASQAWDSGDVDPDAFRTDFAAAFFGSDDTRYGDDIRLLGHAQSLVTTAGGYDGSDHLSWADPFDAQATTAMANVDLRQLRLDAEAAETHLLVARPPLHATAAYAMFLAARRYDALGRRYQIASEVRSYYDDARAHASDPHGPSVRDLFWCRYWFWEQRDTDEELAPLYARAWLNEDREHHLASNLERYHLDAQRAIERADAIGNVIRGGMKTLLPALDDVLHLSSNDEAP